MIPQTLEAESASSNHEKSETESVAETESSVSSSPQDESGLESKKKLRGVRSIRLIRLSSMRSSTKGSKSHNENIDSQMLNVSPNYMKATSSSHAKESFQTSERMFTRKNLTRKPTLKLRRNLTRKLPGGTELKKKLKSSRSIKLTSVKGLRSSRKKENQGKASTFDGSQYSKHASVNSESFMARRLSFKLSNRSMFRPRKVFTDESSQVSQCSDSSVHKATCSSTLKDSHFSDQIELPLEGNGSQDVPLTRKVCPYTYCSLHGRHREDMPPVKHFVSMRRHQLKTQKNTKVEPGLVTGSKYSVNIKKGNQTSHNICSENPVNVTSHFSKSHDQIDKKPARNLPIENFDQYLNDSLAENGYSLSSFPITKETNMECCSTVSYKDKSDSELIETARNNNVVPACDKCDEGTLSGLMDDRDLCGEHSSLLDDSEVAGHEFLGMEASQDKQEERKSILEQVDPDATVESLNATEYRSGGDQSVEKLEAYDQNDVVESTSKPEPMSSSSKIHAFEEEIMTKDKVVDPGCGTLQETSPHRESKPASTTDDSYKMPEGDKKYVRMWRLMYKHAVLSNAEKGEDKLQSNQEDKEAQGKDSLISNRANNSSFQDTDDENDNVVKLVQKAFDEILLPEMEGFSFDDNFESQGIASEDKLLKKSQGKERDGSTSISRDSPQGKASPKHDEDGGGGGDEEKASQKMVNKPETKTPKSWSRLKKVLLLKRFVKAIDNVRKINFRKPRHLPSDANQEAEKVHLRHLTPADGKNVEEWMLDNALQKVISKLAPAQKQRVALLVEAFETVLPFHDIGNSLLSPASSIETQATSIQGLDGSSDLGEEIIDREKEYGFSAKLLLGKAFQSHKTFEDRADDSNYNSMAEQQDSNVVGEAMDGDLSGKQSLAGNHDKEENNTIINDHVYLAETRYSASLSSSMLVDNISTSLKEDQTNEMDDGDSQDMISDSTTEVPSGKSESHGRDFETENPTYASNEPLSASKSLILKDFARALGSSLTPSATPSDLFDESVIGIKENIVEAKPENENLEQFPPAEGTKNQQEKQNHIGLWYLIYRRMASGIAANDFKPLVHGDDETAGTDASIFYGSIPVADQDIPLKDHVTDPEDERRQLEAIKIVEEAIDAILPDAQEHSHDGQPVTDSNISDNSKQSHGVEGVSSEDLFPKEDSVTSNNGVTHEQAEEPALKEGNKPLSGNWRNLKKVIMLRRFVKALEKVGKFNPRGPHYLPVEPDPEAEKVNLRHQSKGERRGPEEWMLDHALRQVVAQLTPARKRKVELLVEAFETVMPTIKN